MRPSQKKLRPYPRLSSFGTLRGPTRSKTPTAFGRSSVNDLSGSWQLEHEIDRSAERIGSRKSLRPNSTFVGVRGLPAGTGMKASRPSGGRSGDAAANTRADATGNSAAVIDGQPAMSLVMIRAAALACRFPQLNRTSGTGTREGPHDRHPDHPAAMKLASELPKGMARPVSSSRPLSAPEQGWRKRGRIETRTGLLRHSVPVAGRSLVKSPGGPLRGANAPVRAP